MAEFVHLMAYPFLACLLVAGIHVYLGIHVIARKVIFVDLALAQIAGLGAVWGVLLGYELHENPWAIRGFSLAFASAGAAVFSLTRMRSERIPQEAIIGITYAVALAASILAMTHLPHGAEEMRELLSGSILWVHGDTLVMTALLYGAIGLFHFVFRRQFLAISFTPHGDVTGGVRVRLWDFLFYVSFGVVVTNSVAIAGVLLVFSFLIIPTVVAVLFAEKLGARLVIGWAVGTVVSFVGVALSYVADLPSGPTIVVCFAACLILAGIIHFIFYSDSKLRQAGKVAAGAAAVAVFIGATMMFEKHDEHGALDMIKSSQVNERMAILRSAEDDASLWKKLGSFIPELLSDPAPQVRSEMLDLVERYSEAGAAPLVERLLTDPDDGVREDAVRCIKQIGGRQSAAALQRAVEREGDEYIRVEMAEALLELGDARGLPALIEIMDGSRRRQVRRDAYEHLAAHVPVKFGFQEDLPPDENDPAILPFRQWWNDNKGRLEWRAETGIFEIREP